MDLFIDKKSNIEVEMISTFELHVRGDQVLVPRDVLHPSQSHHNGISIFL